MDVMQEARRRAGKYFAVVNVFFPLMVVTAVLLAATVVVGYSETTEWLFTSLMVSFGAAVILPFIGYHFAHDSPERVKAQLRSIAREQHFLRTLNAKALGEMQAYQKKTEEEIRKAVEEAGAKLQKGYRKGLKAAYEQSLKPFEAIRAGSSAEVRLRNPELFTNLERAMREAEALYERLKVEPGPEWRRTELTSKLSAHLRRFQQDQAGRVKVWEEKIAEAERIEREAEEALKRLP